MAQREILLIAQHDSNLLGHVDLTDGTYNAVEHNHTSTIDDFYNVNGDLYIEFDDAGNRIAKYLGDGKFAPESEDIAPARFDTSIGFEEVLLKKRWPVGRGGFLKVNTDEWGSILSWDVLDSQGNVYFSCPDWYSNIQIAYPEGYELAPGVAYVPGSAPFLKAREQWDQTREYWIEGGCIDLGNVFVQFIYGPDTQLYEVRSTIVGVDANDQYKYNVTPISSKLVTADQGVAGALQLTNGKFALGDPNSTSLWFWDGVSTQSVTDMSYGILDRLFGARARNDSYIFEYADGSAVDWTLRGMQGQDMIRINMEDLSKTVVSMPAISQIPAVELQEFHRNQYDGNGVRVVSVRTFKTQEGVETVVGALLIEDYRTGTYKWIDGFQQQWQTGRLCPLGELYDDANTFMMMQPYEVTGIVEKSGVKISTDLILVDNETLCVVGRTKSDPVTGAYKFRCYTNRKKSVFARHPVSNGLRLAAEVTPVPLP